ncbi:MAG: hypothetical protein IKQ70_15070 [Bacteroidales bacterium]|nr:hypothetical protein [Bacteroidales bacterium]
MQSLLTSLSDPSIWLEFLKIRTEDGHTKKKELARLKAFVENKLYVDIANNIISGNYVFDSPVKTEINKSGSTKKRIVYRFDSEETLVLKLLAHLLYKYDNKLSPACYSFRKHLTAKNAFDKITAIPNLADKYVLKVDIHNYFNSIPSQCLVDEIKNVIDDDQQLCQLLVNLVLANKAYCYNENGERLLITENRGAMAGVPVSAFFANIYLTSMDEAFTKIGVPYFRYSDDIIVFADNGDDLQRYKDLIFSIIDEKGLTINTTKVKISAPGEEWEFLGFCYRNGNVDLASATLHKIKSKIKRKAKALMRSQVRKGRSFDDVAADLIDHFNRKFYREFSDNDFTWCRWFFPVITTAESLKAIDNYLVEYVRFLRSGRHTKKNFVVDYTEIKELGFKSLVNAYYKK